MNLPELADGVVRLSPFGLEDVTAHVDGEDDVVARWLTNGQPSTVETTTAWVEGRLEDWSGGGVVRRTLAVRDISTGRLAGMVEANLDHRSCGLLRGEVNVSYAIYPWARGRGFAARALLLLCTNLAETGAAVVVLRIHPDNVASLRVATKAGFSDDGLITTADGERFRRFRRPLEPDTVAPARAGARVRLAQPGDASSVATSYVRSWQQVYRQIIPADHLDRMRAEDRVGSFEQLIADPGMHVLVGVYGGEVRGFTAVAVDEDRQLGEVASLYADPGVWGTGVGQALLEGACTWLRSQGCLRAQLWVMEDNARARRFYERGGWHRDGTRRERERGGAAVTDVRYGLDLASS